MQKKFRKLTILRRLFVRRIIVCSFLCFVIFFIPFSYSHSIPTQKQSLTCDRKKALEPKVIQKALDHILSDAKYVSQSSPVEYEDFFLAIALLNYVQNVVSSTQYGYRLRNNGGELPKNEEDALQKNAGICGNQVAVFLLLASKLGLKARGVEFYWRDKGIDLSHIAVEVLINHKWRYFDVSWGTFFTRKRNPHTIKMYMDILSIDEVKNLMFPQKHAMTNSANLSYYYQKISKLDVFQYIKSSDSILKGKTGVIHFSRNKADKKSIIPKDVPNFIGMVEDHSIKDKGNIKIVLPIPRKTTSVNLKNAFAACVGKNQLVVNLNKYQSHIPIKPGENENIEIMIPKTRRVSSNLMLSIEPEDKESTCYITFKQILLK